MGSFPSNGFELHDMHGNVREWVEDCWHYGYAGAPTDGSAWVSGGDCKQRVVRGGSWLSVASNIRSATRMRAFNGYRESHTGFRIAKSLDP